MKRFISILMIFMLIFGVAFAAPSKTVHELNQAHMSAIDGTELPPSFTVNTQVETNFSEWLNTQIKLVLESNVVMTLFDTRTQSLILEHFPLETAFDKIAIAEIAPLTISGYNPDFNEIELNLEFATVFAPTDKLVCVICVEHEESDTENEYVVLAAEPQENGSINIILTPEHFETFKTHSLALMVLKDEVEAE